MTASRVARSRNNNMEGTTTIFTNGVAFKNVGYIAAFFSGIEFLGLAPASVGILLFFILSDIVTGVLKAIVLHGPSSVKSSVFERGLLAKALVVCIPLNIALAGKGTGMDLTVLAQGTITVLILSELYSVLGNMYAIRTGEEKVEFDAVAYVLGQLRKVLKNFITED